MVVDDLQKSGWQRFSHVYIGLIILYFASSIILDCKFYFLGAETPVYLALLPPNAGAPHGEFVSEKKVQNW